MKPAAYARTSETGFWQKPFRCRRIPAKDPIVYLMHIRDCCERINEYAAQGGPDWPSNHMVMDAVRRNIGIIGDASRALDDSCRAAHPEIPWSENIAERDIVIHACEYLKPELIRGIVEKNFPELLANVLRVIEDAKDLGTVRE